MPGLILTFVKEGLIKSRSISYRRSGESRNPVKTIVYWMPFFNGMTAKVLVQRFLRRWISPSDDARIQKSAVSRVRFRPALDFTLSQAFSVSV